jgi:hypothetical protein
MPISAGPPDVFSLPDDMSYYVDGEHWVVIDDRYGKVASWRRDRQAKAEEDADAKNDRAQSLGIVTRYYAVPESMLVIVHQLLLYHRECAEIDWRPASLLPEDYYLQL